MKDAINAITILTTLVITLVLKEKEDLYVMNVRPVILKRMKHVNIVHITYLTVKNVVN